MQGGKFRGVGESGQGGQGGQGGKGGRGKGKRGGGKSKGALEHQQHFNLQNVLLNNFPFLQVSQFSSSGALKEEGQAPAAKKNQQQQQEQHQQQQHSISHCKFYSTPFYLLTFRNKNVGATS